MISGVEDKSLPACLYRPSPAAFSLAVLRCHAVLEAQVIHRDGNLQKFRGSCHRFPHEWVGQALGRREFRAGCPTLFEERATHHFLRLSIIRNPSPVKTKTLAKPRAVSSNPGVNTTAREVRKPIYIRMRDQSTSANPLCRF